MRIISIKLPEKYVEMLDQLVSENKFENRSDAIRTAIKNLLVEMGKVSEDEDVSSSFSPSRTEHLQSPAA